MRHSHFASWITRLFGLHRPRPIVRRRPMTRLFVEALEDRIVPTFARLADFGQRLEVNLTDDDDIEIGTDASGKVEFKVNGTVQPIQDTNGPLDPLALRFIEVFGSSGNNTIDLSRVDPEVFRQLKDRLTHPIEIDGGEGDDIIKGSQGDDLLVGGSGKDQIEGNDGQDLIESDADDTNVDGGTGANTVNDRASGVNQQTIINAANAAISEFKRQISAANQETTFTDISSYSYNANGGRIQINVGDAPVDVAVGSAGGGTGFSGLTPTTNNPSDTNIIILPREAPDQESVITVMEWSSVTATGNGTQNLTMTAGYRPMGADKWAKVVLNNRGPLRFNQIGNVHTLPGYAAITVTNTANVEQADLSIPKVSAQIESSPTTNVGGSSPQRINVQSNSNGPVRLTVFERGTIPFIENKGPRGLALRHSFGAGVVKTSGGLRVYAVGDYASNQSSSIDLDWSAARPGIHTQTVTTTNTSSDSAVVTVTTQRRDFGIATQSDVRRDFGVATQSDSSPFIIGGSKPGSRLVDVATNGLASTTGGEHEIFPVKRAGKNDIVFNSTYTDLGRGITSVTSPSPLHMGDPIMIDVAPDGVTGGNGISFAASSDALGRFIAFQSTSTNLVDGITDDNGGGDIFVRDMFLGQTFLVSRSMNDPNRTANGNSQLPVISGDGRYVYFLSQATDLVATPLNNTQSNLYRFTVETGVIELVNLNVAEDGSANQGVGFNLSTSFDGEIVAFESTATNLTADAKVNAAGDTDVFVRDLVGGVTALASHHHTNATTGNRGSFAPLISSNGATVIYTSRASSVNLVNLPDGNDSFGFFAQRDVFAYDVTTGVNELVSINATGTATANDFSINPQITADGQFVVFQSPSSDLVTGVAGLLFNNNVYLRDLVNDVTEILSVDASGANSGNFNSSEPTVSDDGRYVAFESRATNLSPLADANNTSDVFVRDRLSDRTTLVSANASASAAGNSFSFNAVVSADGKTVFFVSGSENLVTNDGNGEINIFASSEHLRLTFRVTADSNPTNLLLRRNGPDYEVLDADTNTVLATRPAVATDGINIVGADGETETLTVDFDSGLFLLPQGIRFDAGVGGNDRLVTLGTFNTVVYAPINVGDGLAEYDGLVVTYTELEAFSDDAAAENREFLSPGSADTPVRLDDDGNPNNGRSKIDTGTISFVPHIFVNPTATLFIVGTPGDDTIVAAGVDPAFNAALGIDGQQGDDILDVSALNIDATLAGGAGDDDLRGGGGNDLLADGDGNDQLNGGGGDDTYLLTPGSADVLTDPSGTDTLDFRFADAAITLDLDLLNEAQMVNAFGDTVQLGGAIENFIGSVFNDVVSLGPLAVSRSVQGNPEVTGLVPGDTLEFSAGAGIDDGDSISTAGFADVNYAGIEDVNLGAAPRDGGDVQVVLAGGKLTLTGDVKDNFVRIELGVNGPKTVRVTGLDGTLLNGQTGALDFALVKKGVTANLGDGGDLFEVSGAQVPGTMKLDGGNGDDVYRLSATATKLKVIDTLGVDRIDFSAAQAKVKVNLASTLAQTIGSSNTLTLAGTVEQAIGSAFDDVLKGNTAANVLLGLGGNDRLTDKKGQNLLIGGLGTDTLTGGPAADILIGSRTIYDDDPTLLTAILAEFLLNGRTNLEDPSDDPRLVLGDTVLDDGVLDTLFADAADWTFV